MDSKEKEWGRRILLVEDNVDHAFLIKSRLGKLDQSLRIEVAETGEEALRLIEGMSADLILSDYELPGMNGIELLQRLREREIEIPCIFLTGQGSEQVAINALRAGASDYFTKEEGLACYERLANSINKAINKVFMEKELTDYRYFLESIINTIPDPIFIKDRKHRWIVLNQAFCDMTGYRKEDMLKKSDYDFFRKDEADFFWKKDEEMFKTGSLVEIPEEHVTDSRGEVHYLNTIKAPLRDKEGNITHLVGIIKDITERREILDRLKRSEEYYRSLIENSQDIMTVLNPDGTLRYLSPSIEQILGYNHEALIGRYAFGDLFDPNDLPAAVKIFEEILKEPGRVRSMEVRVRHRDGSWRIIEGMGRNLLHDPAVSGIVVNCRDVTARRQMEKDLRDREEKLRLIVENTMDAIYSASPDGTITYISPQVKLYGFSPEEMIGTNLLSYIHPDDAGRIAEEFQTTVLHGREFPSYFRFMGKDGSVFHMEEFGKAIYEKGKVVQVTGVVRSITERLKSEEKYRVLTDALPDVIFIIDRNDRIEYVNSAGAQLLGKRAEELTGKKRADYFPEDVSQRQKERLERVFVTGMPHNALSVSTFNESEIWQDTRLVPITGPGGEVRAVLGIARDITEKMKADLETQKFVSLVESSNEFIGMASLDGRVTYLNESGRRLTGLESREEALSKRVSDFVSLERKEHLQDKVLPHVLSGNVWIGESQIRNFKTGELIDVHITTFLIRSSQKDEPLCVATVMRDIRERMKTEGELREKNKELEDFIYAVAHDLKTPLMSIREYSTFILKQFGEKIEKDGRHIVGRICANSEKAMEMIRGLQNYARYALRNRVHEKFELGSVLKEVIADLSVRKEFREIKIRLQKQWPEIEGDRIVFYQIFLNLVENAAKYGATSIEISQDKRRKYYTICVRDNGMGIDEEFKEKIFDLFSRSAKVADSVEGAGIGLAIVKKAVEKHNGRIWVESRPGMGSVFYITIPIPSNSHRRE